MSQPLPDDVRATRHAYDLALSGAYEALNQTRLEIGEKWPEDQLTFETAIDRARAEREATDAFEQTVLASREAYVAAVEAQNRAAEQAGE